MHFEFLSNRPEAAPQIARWYMDQWGYLHENETLETAIGCLQRYMEADPALPLMVLAMEDDEPIGAAQLKYFEMGEAYPDYEHWLGGVYVTARERGKGIGAKLVSEVVRIASDIGIGTLYLQTEALDGGLYAKLGWRPIERHQGEQLLVLVMQRKIAE